jgi:hypothetical protein
MAIPLIAVILLAAGWCGYWYVASKAAQRAFDKAVANAAAAGNAIDCRNPQWGGFPFRIAVDCDALHLAFTTDRGTTTIDAGAVRNVALAYRPRHVITEIEGPFTIEREGANAVHVAVPAPDKPLRMSIIMDGRRPQQVSVLAENLAGTFALGDERQSGGLSGDFTAERANIHARVGEAADGEAPPLDVVARFDAVTAVSPQFAELDLGEDELRIDTAQLDGTATRFPLERGLSLSERARRWQAADGRFQVRLFRLDTNLIGTSSQGELLLDETGRVEGDITTAVRGFDEFLARLEDARLLEEQEARAAEAIIIVLGKASGDPSDPALEIDTDLKNGDFYFGPFKITQLPSLF